MQASTKLPLKTLLSPLAIALVLATPCAFAKKDLFGNDPAAKQTQHPEQLVSSTSHSSAISEPSKTETLAEQPKTEEKTQTSETKTKSPKESEDEPSYIEKQLARLKGHLVEAKENLFGSKKSTKKVTPILPAQTEQTLMDNAHSSEDAQPELQTISTTDAAQRAQTFAEGQVINVRKYMEDDKPRYAVKLLQKNGRMKTINLDAVSGTLIEETPQ